MTKRSLAIFTAVTALLVILAVVTYRGSGPTGAPEPGDLLYPQLAEQLDQVGAIRVTYRGESFTIERQGENWVIPALDGYIADEEKVAQALRQLSELREFEPKTQNPARYEDLHVEEPTGEEADSRLITLLDGGGETMLSLIVGKPNTTNVLLGRDLVYVRRPDEDRAWLVAGRPSVGKEPMEWAQIRIMNVEQERMRSYELSPADGGAVRVSRASPTGTSSWEIENLPSGREAKQQSVVGGPASALENLSFRGVRQASEIDFGANPAGRAVFHTFDGLVITVTLEREDEETIWARVEARFDENAAWQDEIPERSELLSPEDARGQVEEINARVSGWAYQLRQTPERFMLFDLERLLVPLEEDEESSEQESEEAAPENRDDGGARNRNETEGEQ